MQIISKILILIICAFLSDAALASTKDCSINIIVQNEKATYSTNETITVLVKVQLDDEFCDEAGDVTKIFSKGLKITNRSEWKKLAKNTLGQKLTLTVLGKEKEQILTVYRKTAHYNCFEQKRFSTRE